MDVFKREAMSRLFSGSAWVVPFSFFPTLARAAFLSYFLIFLKERYDLSVDQIGLFVGGFVFLSSVSSLVFGPMLDSLNIKTLMLTSSVIQSAVYLSLHMSGSLVLVFTLCILLNLAYLSLETAVRMFISRLLTPQETASVLSLKYTLTNTAYALGPLVGLWLNRQGISPLFFCSASALIFMAVIIKPVALPRGGDQNNGEGKGWLGSLGTLARDSKLLKFSVASVLVAGVFGTFHIYVGQYVVTTHSVEQAYEIINVVFVTNALVSILLQYLIGRRVTVEFFRHWIVGCMLAFVIGLIGFAFSDTLYAWAFFTVIFTVGEIIIQPLEFLYISRIAPAHMEGAYYSSQNLTYLGSASTPVVGGFILASFSPLYFFGYLMVLLMVGGTIFYIQGGRLSDVDSQKKPLANGAFDDQRSI